MAATIGKCGGVVLISSLALGVANSTWHLALRIGSIQKRLIGARALGWAESFRFGLIQGGCGTLILFAGHTVQLWNLEKNDTRLNGLIILIFGTAAGLLFMPSVSYQNVILPACGMFIVSVLSPS